MLNGLYNFSHMTPSPLFTRRMKNHPFRLRMASLRLIREISTNLRAEAVKRDVREVCNNFLSAGKVSDFKNLAESAQFWVGPVEKNFRVGPCTTLQLHCLKLQLHCLNEKLVVFKNLLFISLSVFTYLPYYY